MQTNASDRYVSVGRFTMPVEPVMLVLDIEARGLSLSRDGNDIIVRPAGRLTAEDRAALRHWRRHILALIDHVEAIQ